MADDSQAIFLPDAHDASDAPSPVAEQPSESHLQQQNVPPVAVTIAPVSEELMPEPIDHLSLEIERLLKLEAEQAAASAAGVESEEPTSFAPDADQETASFDVTPAAVESVALAVDEDTTAAAVDAVAPEVIAPYSAAGAAADAISAIPTEEGGIEILLNMAERGEIDPKNIDIIDVTDRFLAAVAAAPKENLRQSGKIIFQASVLLRMKTEALLAEKVEEEVGFGDDFLDFDADGQPIMDDPLPRQITLQDLERALVRQSTSRPKARHRRVTLEQLIDALRQAEKLEKSRNDRKVKAVIAIDGYADIDGMDDLLDLAHDEDIEAVIARIEQQLAAMLASNDIISLRSIVEALGGKGDWMDAFLAVLFLSNSGKLALRQEEFYGPLLVERAEVA